jgi:hypothetical protein
MKKASSVIRFFIIVLIVAFIAVPKPAAAFIPVAETRVWEWHTEGVEGEEIPMHTITTKPGEWYQLKSNGLKVDGTTHICHPFDEGRFGWTGAIFRLVEGVWVKLATTVGWVPTEEGRFLACATAPAEGTYALFAYFDKALVPDTCEYDTSEWSLGMDSDGGGDYFYASVDNLPFGTFVSYVLIHMDPAGSITGSMSGNGTVGNLYPGDADFLGYNVVIDGSAESATLRIFAAGCVVNLTRFFEADV